MTEGTRLSQLSETVKQLQEVTKGLTEQQSKQEKLMEKVLQQLNSMASNFDGLVQDTNRRTSGEGTSHTTRVHANSLFEGHGGIQARSLRLEFPHFDGGDPSEWIMKAQQFFNYFKTPDDHKMEIASFHMGGKALTWYQWLRDSSHTSTWEEFVEAIRIRFGPSCYEDPVGAFTKLQQRGSVEDYQTEFEVLSNKISGLGEDFRISTFLSGLKDELRITVTMFKPSTLAAAFGLARLQEEEVNGKHYSYRSNQTPLILFNSTSEIPPKTPTPNSFIRPPDPQPQPALRLPAPQRTEPTFQRRNPYPVRRISSKQMQERREKGLFYFCDEKFHAGHKCNRPRLYLLEGLEFESDEERREEAADKLRRSHPQLVDELF